MMGVTQSVCVMNLSIIILKVNCELVFCKQMCAGTGELVPIGVSCDGVIQNFISHNPTTSLI